MPSAAALLLVVPLVWPARFVGADADCFSPDADAAAVEAPEEVAAPIAADPVVAEAPARAPVAVALWDEVVLVTVPVDAPDAG